MFLTILVFPCCHHHPAPIITTLGHQSMTIMLDLALPQSHKQDQWDVPYTEVYAPEHIVLSCLELGTPT